MQQDLWITAILPGGSVSTSECRRATIVGSLRKRLVSRFVWQKTTGSSVASARLTWLADPSVEPRISIRLHFCQLPHLAASKLLKASISELIAPISGLRSASWTQMAAA
jgi:hypothetical protein